MFLEQNGYLKTKVLDEMLVASEKDQKEDIKSKYSTHSISINSTIKAALP